MPLSLKIEENRVKLGDWFALSFQRTLRIPDDGKKYPLPPGLGSFPVVAIDDVRDRLPAPWKERQGLLLPMYQREALWIGFHGPGWHPCAVKIGVGRVNALTGGPWDNTLHAKPQDYLVAPHQPWIDGFKTAGGIVRQFVAVPLGEGDTVEGQVSGEESLDALRVLTVEPKPGRFPDQAPPERRDVLLAMSAPMPQGSMGLGAGGKIVQKLYPDPHGIDTWDPSRLGEFSVYILDSRRFHTLTGRTPPTTPVDAATYAKYGLPWFELYDQDRGDLGATEPLKKVRSVRERDADRGLPETGEDRTVPVDDSTVLPLRPDDDPARSGD